MAEGLIRSPTIKAPHNGTPPGLSDEKAMRMILALREGRTLRSFGVKAPRLKTYFDAHPEYAQEALPPIDANARTARLRKGARLGNRTHCKYGHPFSGENLFISPEGWRRCQVCIAKSHAENRTMSEPQARRVVEALNEGKTIANMTKSGTPSYILNHRALLLFRRKYPKFDRLVVRLSTKNAKIHHAEASTRRAQILRAPYIAAHGDDIFSLIRSVVPDTLPLQIRKDVITAMANDVVEAKLRAADIPRRAREYIAVQYRQISKYGSLSLDARLFEDGNATLLDRLSTEASTGYWDINMMASAGRRK
jgi:hypothetical protein